MLAHIRHRMIRSSHQHKTLRIRLSPSIAAIQHSASPHLVRIHTYTRALTEFLIRLTTHLTGRTIVRSYAEHITEMYIWEKFSIYHRRTDKLYSEENGRENAKPDPIEKKKRNEIGKKGTEHEIKIIERKCSCTRRADEQTRVCVALGVKCIEVAIAHTHTMHTLLLLHSLQMSFHFILF